MLLTEEGEGPKIFKYIFQKSFEVEFHLLYFCSNVLYITLAGSSPADWQQILVRAQVIIGCSDWTGLLGHPRRGGLYRSARLFVCRCGHSLRLGMSG